MKLGATEEQLEVAALFLQPLVLYVLAAMCWAWLQDTEAGADWSLVIYGAGLIVLAYHWRVTERTHSRLRTILVFFVPVALGAAGIATMSIVK